MFSSLSVFRFRRKSRTKWLPGDLSSEGFVLPAHRALFGGYVDFSRFFVAGAALAGHFEVWNVVFRCRCRTSDAFSSVWQVWVKIRDVSDSEGTVYNFTTGEARASLRTAKPAYLATQVRARDWAVATPKALWRDETCKKSARVWSRREVTIICPDQCPH